MYIYSNIANFFSGYYFNPNTAQNVTNKLSDDVVFPVTSNTADILTTTTTGVTSVASPTNTFRMRLNFDNLEIRGKGKLDFTGHNILVSSGDYAAGNTTTFAPDGAINANTVDLGPSGVWTTTNLTGTITTRCGTAPNACP